MRDTTPAIEEKIREMLMKKTPQERLKMGGSMFETSQFLIATGILQNNPTISDKDLRKEVFLRFYGNDFSSDERDKILKHLLAYVPETSFYKIIFGKERQ